MSSLYTLSDEELNSDKWEKAREMCARYGYDIREIAGNIAKFRMDRAAARAQALRELATSQPAAVAPAPATLVHFNSVRQYWNAKYQKWSRNDIVYIGRAMPHMNIELPASPYGNPFRIEKDTDQTRDDAIEMYLNWIQLPGQAHLLHQLDSLRGKMLCCWCHPRRCHGDVLIQLLRERASYTDVVVSEVKPPDVEITETVLIEDWPAEWQPSLKLKTY